MWADPQFLTDLFTFSKEILNGKLDFLCSDSYTTSVLTIFARFNSEGKTPLSMQSLNFQIQI